jgi:Holliday junction resolvase-like predicted endonuclease
VNKLDYYKKHQKGTASEFLAMSWLANQGYYVFKGMGGPIDMIAFDPINIKFINIDVKTIYHRTNGKMASNRRPVKYDFIKILNVDLKNNKVWFNK